MKKALFLFMFGSIVMAGKAQLVNNGGIIFVQNGATLFCSGSLTNTSGTLTNNGKVEVQGTFTNSGTYNTTTNDDSLIMSGAGNVVLNTGGASLNYLAVSKTANTDVVTLGASATVVTKLDYLSGSFTTDYVANPAYVLQAPAMAVFNFAAGREIAGNVKRTGWTAGVARVFNSAQMQVTTAGSSVPTDVTVTMLPNGDPTQTEREVKRKFLLSQTGGSDFTADVRFPYMAGELNTNTEANLVPWSLTASEWNARLTPVARDAAADWVSTTGVAAASFAQEWKLADPRYTFNAKVFLRGAWNGASLNTGLNSMLPLSQPYNIAPFNYAGAETVASIPSATIVDWILLELRKPVSGLPGDATSSTIIGRKAGFLKSDGTIVNTDGVTSISFDIAKQGAAFITVRHRNHLGAMSKSIPSNAAGTFTNDFSVLANAYKNPSVSSQPMMLLAGTTYGLWTGDANRSNSLTATDVTAVKLAISSGSTGYLFQDVNMNGTMAATDLNLTKLMISQGGQTSAPAKIGANTNNKGLQSHIPDPITD